MSQAGRGFNPEEVREANAAREGGGAQRRDVSGEVEIGGWTEEEEDEDDDQDRVKVGRDRSARTQSKGKRKRVSGLRAW